LDNLYFTGNGVLFEPFTADDLYDDYLAIAGWL